MLVKKLSEYCSVLSNEKRFRIVKILVDEGEPGLTLRQLSRKLRLSHSATRRHLKNMTELGLVLKERRDDRMRYVINSEQISQFLDAMRFVLETDWKIQKPAAPDNGLTPRKVIYQSLQDRLRRVEQYDNLS